MLELKKEVSSVNFLSRNLVTLLKQAGLSEGDLAKNLNIPYMTVKRLASGTTNDPRLSTLQLISDYFKISLDSLIGAQLPTIKTHLSIPYMVPILTWEMITETNDISQLDLSKWPNWEPLVLNDSLGTHAFALKSKSSMQERYPQGTLFIIDPDTKPQDNDIVLVKMLKTGGISLRELVIDPPHWYLEPIIANSSSIQFNQIEHQIIGVTVLVMLHTKNNKVT